MSGKLTFLELRSVQVKSTVREGTSILFIDIVVLISMVTVMSVSFS